MERNKFVVIFGGLHIEMSLWRTLGEFLEGSGWTSALCEANIAITGTPDSFLKAAHQVSALALNKLLLCAWEDFQESSSETSFSEWKDNLFRKSPTFRNWNIILELEILVLIFVRAHRIRTLHSIYNHWRLWHHGFLLLTEHKYSHWIPIHILEEFATECHKVIF